MMSLLRTIRRQLFLGLLALVLPATVAHAAWQELLTNGDFENGGTGWIMKNLTLQTDEINHGTKAVKLTPSTFYTFGYQEVDVNPGEEIQASVSVKLTNVAGKFWISVRYYDAAGSQIGSLSLGGGSGTQAWTTYTKKGKVPENTAYARFYAGALAAKGGVAYMDNCSLKLDTASMGAELLTNGGFEGGSTGWTMHNLTLETTHTSEGTRAVKLSPAAFYTFGYQEINVIPGDELTASADIKLTDIAGNFWISVRYYNDKDTQIGSLSLGGGSGSSDWTPYSATGIVPSNTAYARFYAGALSVKGGVAYMDNCSLQVTKESSSNGQPMDFVFKDQQLLDVTKNGGLEHGIYDNQEWIPGGRLYIETDRANVYSGKYSGRLPSAGFSMSGRYRKTVSPGDVYSFSIAASSKNLQPQSRIYLMMLDADKNNVESISVASFLGTRKWRTYSLPNFRIPAGIAYLDIIFAVSGGTNSGATYFDDLTLEQNTGLPINVVPTYESAGFTVLSESNTADCYTYFREKGQENWHEALAPIFDANASGGAEFRGSIVNLKPDTDYEVYALLKEGEMVIGQGGARFHTWNESPHIGETKKITDLYSGSGRLDLSGLSGTPDAWLKIQGTGTNDVVAGDDVDEAVLLKNNQYVILENVQVTGGRRYGIHLNHSYEVRVINCNISGWARNPGFVLNGISYETEADAYRDGGKNNAINMDGGIFLDQSGRITLERNYLHDPRMSANSWYHGHPSGAEGIVIKNTNPESDNKWVYDLIGNHVVRYNDIIGSDNLRWNDGIEGYDNGQDHGSFAKDSDIYGNMICYGQDDVIELDGGQENVRFFGNKGQGFYNGISVAPNTRGPSYVFRNAIFALGDGREKREATAAVKQGGGYTYTRGFTYLLNNTFHTKGTSGISGVGFSDYVEDKIREQQGDTEKKERKRYWAVSYNNIVFGRSNPSGKVTFDGKPIGGAIYDPNELETNTFDYDNLTTGPSTATATVRYSAGQEAHGILDNPPTFMDMDISGYHDDIRPAAGSSAIDAGVVLPNFAEVEDNAPDQGALERGASSLLPIRPINITANYYRISLNAVVGGSSSIGTITLSIGDLGGNVPYTVLKNAATDWLSVSPAAGTLTSNSSKTLTFTVNTGTIKAGTVREAVVLIRLANGFSVPLTVEAHIN